MTELAGKPCLAGDCSCDAEDGEEVCAFHMDADYEPSRHALPLTSEGKWDGFASVRPKVRQKDDRGVRIEEIVRATTYSPAANPSYANRQSRYAGVVELLMCASKGIVFALPTGSDEKKFLNGLRGHLKHARQTMHGRWSVRAVSGQVTVRRIGTHDDLSQMVAK